ncbi:hypothetical protein RJ639_022733 [Escallonia herrerae]|uniref:DUF4219 domain-containing protein n=1 Tax=Escallonia herrerae TaxID=1293975 RepID=A0AA88UZT4_9ASTE|nr:hypothetical protein RJ639_022733 [Escallonia herrerae]
MRRTVWSNHIRPGLHDVDNHVRVFDQRVLCCHGVCYSIGGIEKLTHTNYNDWKSCLESYLQEQDLWDVVNEADTTPPNAASESAEVLRKWKIKARKALFVLKASTQKDLLDLICDAKSPKEA